MILTGKAYYDFLLWYEKREGNTLTVIELDLTTESVIQNALIIEFFDEQEYKIESDVYNLWNYCFVKCYWDRGFKEYKQSVVQAIKKANDLYNSRYENV